MEKKSIGVKGRNAAGGSGGDIPFSDSTPYVSISDDDRSPSGSGSPRLSQTDPSRRSKPKGKQPIKPTRRKIRAKNLTTKSLSHVNIPRPHLASPSGSRKPHSLGGRKATSEDLERIRVKYNIPSCVHLNEPRKGERSENPKYDVIALYINLFDLGLCLPLQPFLRKMFSDMKITLRQLSMSGW